MLFVIGDSTTIRMHELFGESYGRMYDRYRGEEKNDYRDGTWNCRNTDFIIENVIEDIDYKNNILVNAGLWDVGVNIEVAPLSLFEYKCNLIVIFNELRNKCDRLYAFETIYVRDDLGINSYIKQYNDVLRDICDTFGARFIETNIKMDYNVRDDYEIEGFHLKSHATKRLFGIIKDGIGV